MSLRLSVNHCGFDMDSGALCDAIADLTRLAGEIGEVIGMLNAGVSAPPEWVAARVAALRAHRVWLIDQAELLRGKRQLHEARALDLVIRSNVDSMNVTLVKAPVRSVPDARAF